MTPESRFPVGSPARLKPSGYVHDITALAGGPGVRRRRLACGRRVSVQDLTDEYPPEAKRCPICAIAGAPRDE